MKDTVFCEDQVMKLRGELYGINKPLTMGILNLTEDSFFAKSRLKGVETIAEKAAKMVHDGADILDLGAYSTRPGANDVPEKEELKKLLVAIETIRRTNSEVLISVDTFRSSVATKCIEAGADIINDVSGGSLDERMFETVAKLNVPYILMHMRGTPKTMTGLNIYQDLVDDICYELSEKLVKLRQLGVHDVILDPGFGFSKGPSQNFELMARLEEFKVFGLPLLVGISRKSLIWKTLQTTPDEALNGTTALNILALERGAKILRVHDVKEAKEAITLWHNVNRYKKT